jgi:hypothetical protein
MDPFYARRASGFEIAARVTFKSATGLPAWEH